MCALAGCAEVVVQPPGGGRRRLYCSNAHRAEARRRRLAESPESAPGDLLGPAVARLASVLDDLRSYETTLRSIDPGIQAAEMARVRAQATAEVLAAQQLGATAAEDAARVTSRLASERAAWEADHAAHEAEADELRAAVARSREAATAAQDALEAAMGAHRAEIDERDRRAARTDTRHQEETNRLSGELDEARIALAAALARADAADHRAAAAEHAARTAAQQLAETDAAMGQLRIELTSAQVAMDSATQRAEQAEGLVDLTRAELAAERDRHDVSLAELHDQLAQLLARQPTGRPGTKGAAAKKRAGQDR